MNKKPEHLKKFKIIGIIGLAVGFIGIILVIAGFGGNSGMFILGGFMMVFGTFVGTTCTKIGFSPEISKMKIKTAKYIQEDNKEDFKDIADTTVDITGEAVTRVVRSVKDGLDDTMFCKHCGEKIDADSKFCKKCGLEQ